jgi:hypothetical protein
MDYKSLYQKLCERGKLRKKIPSVYLEKHHITPKCLKGSDDKSNLTLLTAREHFLSHKLLCLIYRDSTVDIRSKLASAFNRMCCSNTHKRFYKSKSYEKARLNYSKNHPMKDPTISAKVSQKLRERGKLNRQIKLDNMPFCKCGCGERVINKYNSYINNHWDRREIVNMTFTPELKKELSNIAKNRISKLTDIQKKERLNKTLHNNKIDHIARGKAISLGKKGKKTKQYEIMGKRFAAMNDSRFNEYLAQKSKRVYNRFIKLREIWKSKQ